MQTWLPELAGDIGVVRQVTRPIILTWLYMHFNVRLWLSQAKLGSSRHQRMGLKQQKPNVKAQTGFPLPCTLLSAGIPSE